MFTLDLKIDESPIVNVVTTQNRGSTPDEVAHRCTEKIMSISEDSPPAIRDQAFAFKLHIEKIIAFYMREAIRSDRTSVYNALINSCLLYTSPSPRDRTRSRMPSSA